MGRCDVSRLDDLHTMRDFLDREIAAEVGGRVEALRAEPVVTAVCALYDVRLDDVLRGDRGHAATRARHSIAWLLHGQGWSTRSLNIALGYMNRTSTHAAISRVAHDVAMRTMLAGLGAAS